MARATLFLAFLMILSCSGKTPDNPEKANEVPDKDAIKTDIPQAELFRKSKRLYENGLFTTAIESFETLKNSYPTGPYKLFAELKIADAQFELQKYDTSATLYEEFIKSHPGAPSLPYATLRAGRSHELSNQGTGRDIVPLQKAKDHYERLIEDFPESVYTQAGRHYFQTVAEKLAEHEKFVMDFYRKKENQQAVDAREKRYQETVTPLLEKARQMDDPQSQSERLASEAIEQAPEILGVRRASSVSVSRKVPKAE